MNFCLIASCSRKEDISSVKGKRNDEQVHEIEDTNMARERDVKNVFYLVKIDFAALKQGELNWVTSCLPVLNLFHLPASIFKAYPWDRSELSVYCSKWVKCSISCKIKKKTT